MEVEAVGRVDFNRVDDDGTGRIDGKSGGNLGHVNSGDRRAASTEGNQQRQWSRHQR